MRQEIAYTIDRRARTVEIIPGNWVVQKQINNDWHAQFATEVIDDEDRAFVIEVMEGKIRPEDFIPDPY